MAETLYQIVFRGQIAPDQNIDDVKRKLAAVYKTDVSKIERKLFTGTVVVNKKNMDQQVALKLQSTLTARTGAIFEIKALSADPALKTPPPLPTPQRTVSSSIPKAPPPLPTLQRTASSTRVGFGKRLGALLLDFGLILLLSVPAASLSGDFWTQLFINRLAVGEVEEAGQFVMLLGTFVGVLLSFCMVVILYYFTEGITGASVGKTLLRITIANADGAKAGRGQLLLRYVIKNIAYLGSITAIVVGSWLIGRVGIVLGVVGFFGCFVALGEAKQGLHDLMLKTAVYPYAASKSYRVSGALIGYFLIVAALYPAMYLWENPDKMLLKATKEGHIKTVRKALDKGANVNVKGRQSFFDGMSSHFSNVYDGATSYKIYFSGTPLINAASGGRTAIVKLLSEHHADMNGHNDRGTHSVDDRGNPGAY